MTIEDEGLSLKGRIRALLYGVALGDALGAPVEKLSAGDIRARYGRVTSLETKWHKMDLPDAAPERTRARQRHRHRRHADDAGADEYLWQGTARARRLGHGRTAWCTRSPGCRAGSPNCSARRLLVERLFYPEKWIYQRHQLSGVDPRQGGIGNMVNCGAAMYIAPIGAVNACDPERGL